MIGPTIDYMTFFCVQNITKGYDTYCMLGEAFMQIQVIAQFCVISIWSKD